MTSFVLGGGCFWCLDALYRQIKGVSRVESGYSGGIGTPHYVAVASGKTGHAEVVKVTFDETVIASDVILDLYFLMHNPTTLNRQGADEGTLYRSVMFYANDQQKLVFQAATQRAAVLWSKPLVTQIVPLETFYKAEDEHQDYFRKNSGSGYCTVVIEPKLIKIKNAYRHWFKEEK